MNYLNGRTVWCFVEITSYNLKWKQHKIDWIINNFNDWKLYFKYMKSIFERHFHWKVKLENIFIFSNLSASYLLFWSLWNGEWRKFRTWIDYCQCLLVWFRSHNKIFLKSFLCSRRWSPYWTRTSTIYLLQKFRIKEYISNWKWNHVSFTRWYPVWIWNGSIEWQTSSVRS